MKLIEFIDRLRSFAKPVFTTADIAKILNKNPAYVKTYIYRLKKTGRLEEIERNKYCLERTDPIAIASNLVFPSYISFLSGLKFHHLTTQLPKTVSVACAKSKKEIKKETYSIKFVKLKKQRIFGYKREKYFENKIIWVGEPEKIVVDSLLLPQYCPLDETFNALTEGELVLKKVIDYAMKMDSKVLLKRLGYMLELRDINVYDRLKNKLNNKYDSLNPFLPKMGERNKRWKLIANYVFEAG
jgi:predicted transcriptional regulator of viral defense system